MSEEALKDKSLRIDYTPPPKDWMGPSAEFRKGTYGYPGVLKHEKYLELPNPREWQPTEKDWKLPENWKETILKGMEDRLSGYRSFRLFLDICVRCGACADKCHFFICSGDPKNMPVLRTELLGQLYRRYFTFSGKVFGKLAGARELTEEVLKEWFYYFYQCTGKSNRPTSRTDVAPSENATGRPAKFCALHFANLIWALNIAEIMAQPATDDDTLTQVTEFAIEIGMVPIAVRKEQNGYVLNTWFVALLNAAQTLVTNGVSTPEDVDRSFLICNPGATRGPMAMIDMVGMQTALNVLSYWGSRNRDEQMLSNAAYIKARFVDHGKLGLPTGEGYYRYPDPAYERPDFLTVPDKSKVQEIVALARPAR